MFLYIHKFTGELPTRGSNYYYKEFLTNIKIRAYITTQVTTKCIKTISNRYQNSTRPANHFIKHLMCMQFKQNREHKISSSGRTKHNICKYALLVL